MGEHTQNLVLEIAGLRCRLELLRDSVAQRLEGCHHKAIKEYRELVDELFSASLSIKNRFEEYR